MLYNCLAVGAGGALGAVARYLVGLLPVLHRGAFPLHTLVINGVGAVVIGLVVAAGVRTNLSPTLLLFLQVGVCGGFTTFSTFSLESLVLLEDGALETMVALFPVTLSLPDGAQASSAYIYALATHPGARKKGFGRFILNYVDFYLQEKKLDCVTIVPAEASLHRFFAAAGFSECFATRKVELLQYMARRNCAGDTLAPADPETYNRVRERLLEGTFRVSYADGAIGYQEGLSRMANSGLYLLNVNGTQGCAAAEYLNEDSVLVKELIIPAPAMAGAAALLAGEIPMYRAADASTRLLFLGDILYCPLPLFGGLASLGDILLAAGVFFCLMACMRPSRLPMWLTTG